MSAYKLICALGIALAFTSCKSTDISTSSWNKSIPASYLPASDSMPAVMKPWRESFFDPNLISLIDTALKHNYDLREAMQKIETARAGIQFTKGIRLPSVAAYGSAGIRKFGDYTMDGVGNYDTQFSTNINSKQQIPNPLPDYFIGIQSSWEIDLWGKLKSKKKAAASRFIASQYGRDLIVTNLIAEVANTYYELAALDQSLDILANNITLQQEALDIVKSQKEAGKANELAVELLQAQLLSSKASAAENRQKRIEAEAKLSFLCGSFPKAITRDTAYYSQQIMPTIAAGVPASLLANRPDIRQAEMQLSATNADVHAARTAFYPTLTLNGSLGFQSFTAALLLESPASLAYSLFGGLTAPLINRRQLKADLMASRSEQKQAYIQYEKTVVNSFTEVYVAIQNIQNTNDMYALKTEEVDMLRQSVTTSSELFKAGRANYLEIILAQKNALQSQLELVSYQQRRNAAVVSLYRSLGGGWK